LRNEIRGESSFNPHKPLKINNYKYIAITLLLLPIIAISCSTGIEGTKKITVSRAEQHLLDPQPEDALNDSIKALPLNEWGVGKEFLVADNKASMVYEITDRAGNRVHGDSLNGVVVAFDGVESQSTPAGDDIGVVRFVDRTGGRTLRYVMRKNVNQIGDAVWSDFPMLIDVAMAQQFNSRLKGRRLWVRTGLWYDEQGQPMRRAKFIPVTIKEVTAGNSVFPLAVRFNDGKVNGWLPMNMPDGKGLRNSRGFASLFSLTDPKLKYPNITPEVWDLICRGRVTVGMTKEECRLSLGNPQEVDSGHNWDQLIDYWKYADGSYLMFVDDKIVNYRK